MKPSESFKERLHYRVDNFLAKGNSALFIALVVAFVGSIVAIAVVRLVIHLVAPDADTGFMRQVWMIFLQLTDPGNMNQDNETPTIFKVTAVIAGLTGVVIFSALIAFLTTALDQAITDLKRGHSRVPEAGHTIILGWGDRVVEILKELVEAKESEPNPCVVIMAEIEKEQMDEFLYSNFGVAERGNTRIVTRSGAATSLQSLEHVNAGQAKAVIVLASCKESAPIDERLDSDARVIKSVLALDSVSKGADFPIVTEVFNVRNRSVVEDISPERVYIVDAQEVLAKVMVQTSRTSGLSVVYSELLSFDGCEMYFYEADWGGIDYGTVQYHFPDGVPIGLRLADGSIQIRPALNTKLNPGDEVLIVAEDDSTIEFLQQPVMTPTDRQVPGHRIQQKQERKLIIGWSPKAPTIISEYAEYVLEGSEVIVILKEGNPDIVNEIQELSDELDKLTVKLVEIDPLDSGELTEIKPFSFNNLIILPQNPRPEKDAERIDSETIVILLHLRRIRRDLLAAGQVVETKIVTEVLESANQSLVDKAGVDDFVISNRMVSMIFAQISEEPDIQLVYDDLFQEDGSEIYVKPAELYFSELPITLPFGDLMRVAQNRDEEVCIGWKCQALEADADANYGVKLIPFKDTMIDLQAGDSLVVVAEDDM